MNFLIVDDNRLLTRFLTIYLRGKGRAATAVHDPTKVMEWLTANSCDAIILDIGMPKIDGITLLREHIRPNYPDLPVVIFTGLGYDDEAMSQCRIAGANGYVSKGLGPSEIYSAVMRVVDQRAPAGR